MLPGVEAIAIDTARHFPRHSHDGYGIGLMHRGAHRSWSGVGAVEAVAGDLITVNPGEMHDGRPVGADGRGWRMLFVEPAVLDDATAPEMGSAAEIVRPVLRDPLAAQWFDLAFRRLAAPRPDALAAQEALVACLHGVMARHGARSGPADRAAPAVARARQRLDEVPERPVTLAELAAVEGLSRFQLLRGFARQTGATPHAYQMQARVRLARRLLGQDRSPVEAALAAGFADQSHMTRAFGRQFGLTPARYRAARNPVQDRPGALPSP